MLLKTYLQSLVFLSHINNVVIIIYYCYIIIINNKIINIYIIIIINQRNMKGLKTQH